MLSKNAAHVVRHAPRAAARPAGDKVARGAGGRGVRGNGRRHAAHRAAGAGLAMSLFPCIVVQYKLVAVLFWNVVMASGVSLWLFCCYLANLAGTQSAKGAVGGLGA